jgi:hypothetical protein
MLPCRVKLYTGHQILALQLKFVTQIGLAYRFTRCNLAGRAGFENLSLNQNVRIVASAESFSYIVIGNEYTDPAALKMRDNVFNVNDRQRVDTGKRLIKKYE